MSESATPDGGRWLWPFGLGAVLIVLGILCIWKVLSGNIDNQMIIGVFMLVAGVAEGIHAVFGRAWRDFASDLTPALLYVLSGGIILGSPVTGYFLLTLVVAAALITGAIYRIATLWFGRQLRGWHLLAVAGAVTLLVWLLLLWAWPAPGFWILGTIAAAGLLATGVSWIRRGLAARKAHEVL
jgi:uncharacterized membrane protein HdeD (DUF308 family)